MQDMKAFRLYNVLKVEFWDDLGVGDQMCEPIRVNQVDADVVDNE